MIDILEQANNLGFCSDCNALVCTYQQTETDAAEYDCPAIEDEQDCVFIEELI